MHVKAKSCNAANKRDVFHTERGQLMQTMHCIKCIVSCYIRMCTYTHIHMYINKALHTLLQDH